MSQELRDVIETVLTGPVLQTKLSWKWTVSLMNLTYLLESCFNDILIPATTTHVGKSKPNKKFKPWITPYVQAKIYTRNHLRRMTHQNRQESIDACCEATKAISKAKTESWKDFF